MFKVPAKDILDAARVLQKVQQKWPDHEELYVTVDENFLTICERENITYGSRMYKRSQS